MYGISFLKAGGLPECGLGAFVTLSADALQVEPLGQLFVRNVAMVFDRYLASKRSDTPIFSRTV